MASRDWRGADVNLDSLWRMLSLWMFVRVLT